MFRNSLFKLILILFQLSVYSSQSLRFLSIGRYLLLQLEYLFGNLLWFVSIVVGFVPLDLFVAPFDLPVYIIDICYVVFWFCFVLVYVILVANNFGIVLLDSSLALVDDSLMVLSFSSGLLSLVPQLPKPCFGFNNPSVNLSHSSIFDINCISWTGSIRSNNLQFLLMLKNWFPVSFTF